MIFDLLILYTCVFKFSPPRHSLPREPFGSRAVGLSPGRSPVGTCTPTTGRAKFARGIPPNSRRGLRFLFFSGPCGAAPRSCREQQNQRNEAEARAGAFFPERGRPDSHSPDSRSPPLPSHAPPRAFGSLLGRGILPPQHPLKGVRGYM